MRLSERPAKRSAARVSTAAICALLGVSVSATTLAFGIHVGVLAPGDGQFPSKSGGAVAVKAEIMAKQVMHKVSPVYPENAKKARLQGTVELEAVISKSGDVEEVKAVSGPKELEQSALNAVRQWTYRPSFLNGEPVEVRTTIHVVYIYAVRTEGPEPLQFHARNNIALIPAGQRAVRI